MISKNELKYIQSLCQKKQRQAEGIFVVEGTKLAEELLNSDYSIRKIYALADWVALYKPPFDVVILSEEELQKISQLQTPNKVLILAEQKIAKQKPNTTDEFTIVLDGIQDPGNLGTIIRIADWFGVRQIVASEHSAELYNPKVIQSTMGSFIRVSVWYQPLAEFLLSVSLPVYGALLQGENVKMVPAITKGVLVIGNESKGISHNLLPMITHPITIPKLGGAESLNAAVAAGIVLSHLKQ